MVNMSDSKEKILDHDYDGIREADNPLPRWWLNTFYLCIIFAVAYFIYYQMAGGPTLTQELERAQAARQATAPGPTAGGGDEKLLALASDPAQAAAGKAHYTQKCAACHGDVGQGVIGPNLTDKFWIHGKGTPADILRVVRVGVGDKGMPAWEAMMKPEEIGQVVSFVGSLKGTTPPNPKAPQGEAIE
jgi:cytochrome c oxidase cbb3-type subunit 3